ncbi:histidinol-phosphate transaminase [Luteimonas sp. MC1572]|uniref:histidinol-phosphate transaminase n=1 Tax=Luteimonas sp. MC1572 TaxID=2799325 RepID=UPI0018F0C87B|nr:histidinol-phosphate transaminase [Luteimonas sp. MC1572]MBJ6980498.1 histidinol-phosphate transaminase [Luteimonas sp. MC1572]QQO04375.1 histidinol-phosphate transaminase [Luteimonas sp. MC1572]
MAQLDGDAHRARRSDDAAWALARAVAPVRALRAYDPGHDIVALRRGFAPSALLELGSNENPYGPGPRAREAAAAALGEIHRYPDPLAGELKRALAAHHGVDAAQLVMGNGSHELLMQLAQVFAGPGDEVLVPEYGFAVFTIAAHAVGASLRRAPAFAPGAAMPRGHDLDALCAAITPATRLVYIDNPNNPTGTWFGTTAFARFMDAVPDDVVVVVDEAYAELADAADFASALALLPRHRNLVITRTFSKAYALAGLRIGYAIANASLAAMLERVRESFNVGLVAQAAAIAALGDKDWLEDTSQRNREERARLAAALRARGFTVAPSQANFLLVETGAATPRIEAVLLASGIVLRPMAGYGLPASVRITVGTAADNARLLQALDALP